MLDLNNSQSLKATVEAAIWFSLPRCLRWCKYAYLDSDPRHTHPKPSMLTVSVYSPGAGARSWEDPWSFLTSWPSRGVSSRGQRDILKQWEVIEWDTHIYTLVGTPAHTWTYAHVWKHIHEHAHLRIPHWHIIYMYICVCMYVCMYIWACVNNSI